MTLYVNGTFHKNEISGVLSPKGGVLEKKWTTNGKLFIVTWVRLTQSKQANYNDPNDNSRVYPDEFLLVKFWEKNAERLYNNFMSGDMLHIEVNRVEPYIANLNGTDVAQVMYNVGSFQCTGQGVAHMRQTIAKIDAAIAKKQEAEAVQTPQQQSYVAQAPVNYPESVNNYADFDDDIPF
jgi:single-stranded DNA-binding protein